MPSKSASLDDVRRSMMNHVIYLTIYLFIYFLVYCLRVVKHYLRMDDLHCTTSSHQTTGNHPCFHHVSEKFLHYVGMGMDPPPPPDRPIPLQAVILEMHILPSQESASP